MGERASVLPSARAGIYSEYFNQPQPYSFDSQWGPLLPASAFVRYRAHPTPWMAPFSDITDTRSSGFFLPRPCPPLRAGMFALGTYKDGTAVVSWAFP